MKSAKACTARDVSSIEEQTPFCPPHPPSGFCESKSQQTALSLDLRSEGFLIGLRASRTLLVP